MKVGDREEAHRQDPSLMFWIIKFVPEGKVKIAPEWDSHTPTVATSKWVKWTPLEGHFAILRAS